MAQGSNHNRSLNRLGPTPPPDTSRSVDDAPGGDA